jgi:hypothetical protein
MIKLTQIRQSIILRVMRRYFWGLNGGFLRLIGILEIIGHVYLRYSADDWTYPKLWHLTCWSIWFIILVVIQVRKDIYA